MTVCLLCGAHIAPFGAYCQPCLDHVLVEIRAALIQDRPTQPRMLPRGQALSGVLCRRHIRQTPSLDPGAIEVNSSPLGGNSGGVSKGRRTTGAGTQVLRAWRDGVVGER